MRYVIGDSARLVTPYRGYSWVTIIGYEGDGYCVELTSGLEIVVREDELEDVLAGKSANAPSRSIRRTGPAKPF